MHCALFSMHYEYALSAIDSWRAKYGCKRMRLWIKLPQQAVGPEESLKGPKHIISKPPSPAPCTLCPTLLTPGFPEDLWYSWRAKQNVSDFDLNRQIQEEDK